ncbi:hAT family dimerization protein [Ceratobasidium sp. AG-Ba]|nr:hAT family dimerization protein [Ceratobasidium sp. AG-Ba]
MPAVPTSPVRHRRSRRHGLNALTEIEAWPYSDDEIIAASFGTWRSQAYQHYKVYLERRRDEQGNPKLLMYRFECKYGYPTHLPQYRERMKTGNGTRNLQDTAETCNARWGVTQNSQSNSTFFNGYSEARHRVLIALRCAQNKRAFNLVSDPLYQQEVEMLRPGTILPSLMTVSQDMQVIYATSAEGVKEYFKNTRSALHFAIDGWTSPQSLSFLGLVVIWYSEGKVWRSILEFIHLTHAHKGEYLASRIEECLKRYGIARKVTEPSTRPAIAQASPATTQPDQAIDDIEEDNGDVLKPNTDPDKQDFDDHKIQKNVQKAFDQMAAEKVIPPQEQLREGRSIMTKVL